MSQVSLVPILLWVAALACARRRHLAGAASRVARLRHRSAAALFVSVSARAQGLWAFIGHVFFAEQAAASIGWANTPFQYEVGVANLGLGLACDLCRVQGLRSAARGGDRRRLLSDRRGNRPHRRYRRTGKSRAGQCRADPGHRFSHAASPSSCCWRSPARNGGRNRRPRSRSRPSWTSPARRCAITAHALSDLGK